MSASEDRVKELVAVAQAAILKKVEEMAKAELDLSGDDVISAYVTMCQAALKSAKKHGIGEDVLVGCLQKMILEISEPKGQVS